jgi:hypothetical protein
VIKPGPCPLRLARFREEFIGIPRTMHRCAMPYLAAADSSSYNSGPRSRRGGETMKRASSQMMAG